MGTLELKDTGPAVTALTKKLVEHGEMTFEKSHYDFLVYQTIVRLQETYGAKVDGIVGNQTRHIIDNYLPREGVIRLDEMPPECFGGSVLGRAALAVALDEMRKGARETKGNNKGVFINKYLGGEPGENHRGAWCAGFTEWCIKQARNATGLPSPFNTSIHVATNAVRARTKNKLFWTPQGAELYRKRTKVRIEPEFIDADIDVQPGDLLLTMSYDEIWDIEVWLRMMRLGHIGFVHHKEVDHFYSCEGNFGPYPAWVGPQKRSTHARGFMAYIRL